MSEARTRDAAGAKGGAEENGRREPRGVALDVVAQLPTRSDDLAQLRSVFAAFPLLAQHVGAPEEARLIIDANAVIADIRWMVKKRKTPGARTALQEAIASKTVAAFAPSYLDDEIRLNLTEVSANEGVPLEPMLAAWEEYRACIRFYEARRPSIAATPDVVDPKDLPYIETYLALGASAILTNDPHLERMGARTVRLELAVAMRDYARAASVELTLKWHGVLLLTLGIGFAQQFAQVLAAGARVFRRAPRGLQLAASAALVAALLHPPIRERLTRALARGWNDLVEATKHSLPIVAELTVETQRHGERARAAWAAVAPQVEPRRVPLRTQALAVCVASAEPLPTDELIERLTRLGVRTTAKNFRRYLRQVLRAHPSIIEVGRDSWAPVAPRSRVLTSAEGPS